MAALLNLCAFATVPLWWPLMLLIELVQVALFPATTPLGCAIAARLERRRPPA